VVKFVSTTSATTVVLYYCQPRQSIYMATLVYGRALIAGLYKAPEGSRGFRQIQVSLFFMALVVLQ